VIIEFLEGDPDQPIITGRVYNADNMPPYELPGDETLSGLKSNSSKGGGGFNEIRFEDKKGEEQVFMHAEKNFDLRVKNDRFETIVNNRHLIVEKDKFEHVKNARNETVDSHHNEKIGGDLNLKVVGKEAKLVKKTLSLKVEDNVAEVFEKNHHEEVTKDYFLKAKNVVIEGTTNITFKVGQSSIAMSSSGVKIANSTGTIEFESMNLKGEASIGLELKGGVTAKVEGVQTEVKGSAMLTVQGGLVKIN